MSSPIISIEDLSDLPTAMRSAGVCAEHVDVFASAVAEGETALALIARRAGPPPEVLTQIATAAMIEDELREGGRQLRFCVSDSGRTVIEVRDRDGVALATLSTAEAVEIAAGKPLE
jgi:hypothetical protein